MNVKELIGNLSRFQDDTPVLVIYDEKPYQILTTGAFAYIAADGEALAFTMDKASIIVGDRYDESS